jgi:hypothetical protein
MTAILYVNGVKVPRLYSKRLAEKKLGRSVDGLFQRSESSAKLN